MKISLYKDMMLFSCFQTFPFALQSTRGAGVGGRAECFGTAGRLPFGSVEGAGSPSRFRLLPPTCPDRRAAGETGQRPGPLV